MVWRVLVIFLFIIELFVLSIIVRVIGCCVVMLFLFVVSSWSSVKSSWVLCVRMVFCVRVRNLFILGVMMEI